MKYIWCSSFPEVFGRLKDRGGVSLPFLYLNSSICGIYLVKWLSRDLCSIGRVGQVSLPWVYVHSSVCETYLVQ